MATKCPMCGAPLENNVCTYCGYKEKVQQAPASSAAPQQVVQPQPNLKQQTTVRSPIIAGISKKNKMVALLLCIFLGYFGVHRFYVGKIGTGILYLFTCGLFGIGWFVDIILIATGSFKDQFSLPLRQ